MIETTPEHPFYTDDSEWVEAEDLEVGEEILSLDGDYGTVENVIVIDDVNQPMYNLTVADAHTFFVGDGDWLVHNACPDHSSDPRFQDLSRDADHEGRIDAGSQLEAQAILQAEADGIVSSPTRNPERGVDFYSTYNTSRIPTDTKTPVQTSFRPVTTQVSDVVSSGRAYGEPTLIVVDLRRLTPAESNQFSSELLVHPDTTWQQRLSSGFISVEFVNASCCD